MAIYLGEIDIKQLALLVLNTCVLAGPFFFCSGAAMSALGLLGGG